VCEGFGDPHKTEVTRAYLSKKHTRTKNFVKLFRALVRHGTPSSSLPRVIREGEGEEPMPKFEAARVSSNKSILKQKHAQNELRKSTQAQSDLPVPLLTPTRRREQSHWFHWDYLRTRDDHHRTVFDDTQRADFEVRKTIGLAQQTHVLKTLGPVKGFGHIKD
jgi:hypothetical protein